MLPQGVECCGVLDSFGRHGVGRKHVEDPDGGEGLRALTCSSHSRDDSLGDARPRRSVNSRVMAEAEHRVWPEPDLREASLHEQLLVGASDDCEFVCEQRIATQGKRSSERGLSATRVPD
jgi:hypothetical protein